MQLDNGLLQVYSFYLYTNITVFRKFNSPYSMHYVVIMIIACERYC